MRCSSEAGITLARLAREPFVVREAGSDTRHAMVDALGRHGDKLKIALEVKSTETIKQAVIAGMGVAFLSGHTVSRELRDGSLVALDVVGFPLMLNWYLVQRRTKRLPPVAQAFREFLLSEGAALLARLVPLPACDQAPGRSPSATSSIISRASPSSSACSCSFVSPAGTNRCAATLKLRLPVPGLVTISVCMFSMLTERIARMRVSELTMPFAVVADQLQLDAAPAGCRLAGGAARHGDSQAGRFQSAQRSGQRIGTVARHVEMHHAGKLAGGARQPARRPVGAMTLCTFGQCIDDALPVGADHRGHQRPPCCRRRLRSVQPNA